MNIIEQLKEIKKNKKFELVISIKKNNEMKILKPKKLKKSVDVNIFKLKR